MISAYEVWNEPNGYLGWSPTPSAADYSELLKAAYTAIKTADPEATVIGGVVGTGVSLGTDTINAVDFIEQMYAAGAGEYFDALSIHPYSLSSEFSDGTGSVDSAIEQVKEIRALMDANGDTDKLIWATEYGMPTVGSYTEATQSEYLQDFLEAWSTLTGVGPMFIYSLVDQDTGDSNVENNWGLYTDTWTAKDAAAVLAAWLAAYPTLAEAGYTPAFPTEDAGSGNALTDFLKNLNQFVVSIKATIGSSFGVAWARLTTLKVTFTAVMTSLSSALGNVQTRVATALNSVVGAVASALSSTTAATTTSSTTTLAASASSTTQTALTVDASSVSTAEVSASPQTEEKVVAAETVSTTTDSEAMSATTTDPSTAKTPKRPLRTPRTKSPKPALEGAAGSETASGVEAATSGESTKPPHHGRPSISKDGAAARHVKATEASGSTSTGTSQDSADT